MDFWRSEAYQRFFSFLEATGGFYYEVRPKTHFLIYEYIPDVARHQRWGDAPVHSIAVSLLARRDQVHFFRDIGYRHEPFQHCPSGEDWEKGHCSCSPGETFGTYIVPGQK